jgi:hypothetical protein
MHQSSYAVVSDAQANLFQFFGHPWSAINTKARLQTH